MRLPSIFTLLAVSLLAGSVMGQSLSEVAKKEKERRKENEKKTGQVQVITENELNQVRRESPPSEESEGTSTTSQAGSRTTSSRPRTGAGQRGDQTEEGGAPTEIPSNASMMDKIAIFEQMLTAHRTEIAMIDEEIAKNNTRLEAIEQELISIGAGGLPVAPQVDQQVRNPADAVGLRAEQNELRQKNQQLQAQKAKSAGDLRQKGRRAGIPAGYLRF